MAAGEAGIFSIRLMGKQDKYGPIIRIAAIGLPMNTIKPIITLRRFLMATKPKM